MRSGKRTTTVVCAAVALIAFGALGVPAAQAGPVPENQLTGHWAGYAQSANGDDNTTPPFTIEVRSQRGMVIRGRVSGLGGPDTKVPFRGIASGDGHLRLIGQDHGVIAIILELRPAPLAAVPGLQPGGFEGRYVVRTGSGVERGRLVAVHQMPDPNAPSIAGLWAGTAQAIGDPNIAQVSALFTQDANGILAGGLSFGAVAPPDPDVPARFDIAGHIERLAGGAPGVELVGAGSEGLILIIGGAPVAGPQPHLDLSYRLIPTHGGFGAAEEGSIVIVGG